MPPAVRRADPGPPRRNPDRRLELVGFLSGFAVVVALLGLAAALAR